LTQAGVTDEEMRRAAAASLTVSTGTYTAEKVAGMAERNQTRSAQGRILKSENHVTGFGQSRLTFKNQISSGDGDSKFLFSFSLRFDLLLTEEKKLNPSVFQC